MLWAVGEVLQGLCAPCRTPIRDPLSYLLHATVTVGIVLLITIVVLVVHLSVKGIALLFMLCVSVVCIINMS